MWGNRLIDNSSQLTKGGGCDLLRHFDRFQFTYRRVAAGARLACSQLTGAYFSCRHGVARQLTDSAGKAAESNRFTAGTACRTNSECVTHDHTGRWFTGPGNGLRLFGDLKAYGLCVCCAVAVIPGL